MRRRHFMLLIGLSAISLLMFFFMPWFQGSSTSFQVVISSFQLPVPLPSTGWLNLLLPFICPAYTAIASILTLIFGYADWHDRYKPDTTYLFINAPTILLHLCTDHFLISMILWNDNDTGIPNNVDWASLLFSGYFLHFCVLIAIVVVAFLYSRTSYKGEIHEKKKRN